MKREYSGGCQDLGHIAFKSSGTTTFQPADLVSISNSLLPSNTNKMKLAIAALLAGSAAAFAPSQQGARSATQLHETKVSVESV